MAGYWPSSFFACLWVEMQKETRPISSHVDQTSLVNKGFTGIICDKEQTFLQDTVCNPEWAR